VHFCTAVYVLARYDEAIGLQDEPSFIGIIKNAVVVEDGHSSIVQDIGNVL
jgi:hypothetical protein